jgi:hypothetical protein
VGGDDQVVCAARKTGSADMGEQASVVGRGRLRVVKDIDGGCYRHECPGAFGSSVSRIRHLNADAVLGDRYRGELAYSHALDLASDCRAVLSIVLVGNQIAGSGAPRRRGSSRGVGRRLSGSVRHACWPR